MAKRRVERLNTFTWLLSAVFLKESYGTFGDPKESLLSMIDTT
jgi:hypothetical protein